MKMDFRYTKHQVPRGAFADAESGDRIVLLKNVPILRLTYQVRLLTFRAGLEGKKLHVEVPKGCRLHPSLRDHVDAFPNLIRIVKV